MNDMLPIAHVSESEPRRTQALSDHLSGVESLAAQFAAAFEAADWAAISGRWHDLGKFSDEFQCYIRQTSGFEAELALGAPRRVDHSTAGALLAVERFGSLGKLLAYVISGHHAGLPDGSPADNAGVSALDNRLRRAKEEGLLERARARAPHVLLDAAKPTLVTRLRGADEQPGGGLHLWVRMLFSCLVEADYLDTEKFHDPQRSEMRGGGPGIGLLLDQFNAFMEEKQRNAPETDLNRIRAGVLRQCREQAASAPGFFTLTVPTGGGKTLSSLAFALEHARRYGKRRIVYAIPYTSIIEQTANVFREVFNNIPGAVLEHHSNIRAEVDGNERQETEASTEKSRLAAENWDAPLIVTTNVQLFESLFAARPSRCRKLHNIVDSVLILDEAQLLPPDFLEPILDALKLLVKHYGVTVVLCTATQPALTTQRAGAVRTLLHGIDNGTEIVAKTEQLYRSLDRVRVHAPRNLDEREHWEAIAERVLQHPSVLAIVNTRAGCRTLHALMPKGTIHLSALMCGEHRSYVIGQIRERLAVGEPVRVVSTQLIEAGVDVDFPVVYRALAGLDSIAQAAGRCNREGRLADKGEVYVFVPPEQAPRGLLRFGEEACKLLLEDHPDDPLAPAQFDRYFRHYYAKAAQSGGLDRKNILGLLKKDAAQWCVQFRTAAERFQLIEETASVVVPYCNPGDAKRDSRMLLRRLRAGEWHRELLRSLQRFTVSVRPHEFSRLFGENEVEEIVAGTGLWTLRSETAYSDELGLLIGADNTSDAAKLYI
jgi:CRISPR-associated endonuclease/helicase Cas3